MLPLQRRHRCPRVSWRCEWLPVRWRVHARASSWLKVSRPIAESRSSFPPLRRPHHHQPSPLDVERSPPFVLKIPGRHGLTSPSASTRPKGSCWSKISKRRRGLSSAPSDSSYDETWCGHPTRCCDSVSRRCSGYFCQTLSGGEPRSSSTIEEARGRSRRRRTKHTRVLPQVKARAEMDRPSARAGPPQGSPRFSRTRRFSRTPERHPSQGRRRSNKEGGSGL